MYLRLLLSIFTNLLQIQFVIVADRRSSEHTFSRYHEALILAFPRFSSQTLLPFYATLKLGWKRNLDKDGIFVEGGGGQNSIVEKLKICKGNRKPGKRSWENRMKSPNVRKNFSPLSRRKMMTFHRIMQPWNFVRCRNYNWSKLCNNNEKSSTFHPMEIIKSHFLPFCSRNIIYISKVKS